MRVVLIRGAAAVVCLVVACVASLANAVEVPLELPRVLDDRLKIELFAADPDIVTPAGLAVDARGRVLVVESHTHFRPENYQGPPADRIRMLVDTDRDGRADRITTFFEGTRSTMNVGVHPDGSVYVATRMAIIRLRDTNDDGVADENTPIAHLETAGDYPHNGLSGFAFDFVGNVYFGLGENLGSVFKLIGSDGSYASELEGGHVYRCRADGSQVERVAIGFWNPFHVAFDAFGRLFTVDNDPDSLPPCRLIQVVDGGNYGYRYRNGRKGVHPFTAWNGEIPGTLPMLAGTGEAPSAVVPYESDELPPDYLGNLLVTSWGDHRLDRFKLKPRGASYQAVAEAFVKGGENFRPVGMATAPDGSLIISDWVLQDYNLHRKGRVWRVSAKKPKQLDRPASSSTAPQAAALHAADRRVRETAARELLASADGRKLLTKLSADAQQADPRTRALALVALASAGDLQPARNALQHDASVDVRLAAVRALGSTATASDLNPSESSAEVRAELLRHSTDPSLADTCWQLVSDGDAFVGEAAREGLFHLGLVTPQIALDELSPQQRLAALLILREHRVPGGDKLLAEFLRDADPDVRFAAVQWVGEERLMEYRDALTEALAAGPATERIFGGYLAALERLDGVQREPSDEWAGEQYIVRALENKTTSPEALRWALRMLRPDHPLLSLEKFREYLGSDDPAIQLEAIRSLRDSKNPGRTELLIQVAASPDYSPRLRAEAIVGISPEAPQTLEALLKLAGSDELAIRNEALRSLRGADLDDAAKAALKRIAKQYSDSQELVTRALQPATVAPASTNTADQNVDHWLSLLHTDGAKSDPEAGERIFYHARAAACSRCHQVGGRGARIGPELTATTGVLDERRLVESIVRPSKEIAPQFVSWIVLTTAGQSLTGVLVDELATGEQTYADAEGKLTQFKAADIESRRPLPTSLMPEGLPAQLTDQEFRDLVAFLRSQSK